MEKMHFTRMDQGSDEDFQILKRVHETTLAKLPDLLMGMVEDLSGDQAYNISRRDHSLQAATRALRDGADESEKLKTEFRFSNLFLRKSNGPRSQLELRLQFLIFESAPPGVTLSATSYGNGEVENPLEPTIPSLASPESSVQFAWQKRQKFQRFRASPFST